MISEAQHTRWRRDIANNIQRAMTIANTDFDDAGEAQKASAVLSICIETNKVISNTMIAERLSELSLALYRNDEIVERLSDELTQGKSIAERLSSILQTSEHYDLPEDLAQDLISWAATEDMIAEPRPQGDEVEQLDGEIVMSQEPADELEHPEPIEPEEKTENG